MRRLRSLSILVIFAFASLLGAASVVNTATCGGASTTVDQSAAICSGMLMYASASGSLTQVGNTLTISSATSSSYYYSPAAPQPRGVPSRAESVISGNFATDGLLRGGYAEIVFNDLFIQHNNTDTTLAEFTILMNGTKVYDCFTLGGGITPCATSTLLIPIELGSTFSLQVDDVSSSPTPDFHGGISADLTVSLLEGQSSSAANVTNVAPVPEPGAVGLVLVGLCVLVAKRRHSRAHNPR